MGTIEVSDGAIVGVGLVETRVGGIGRGGTAFESEITGMMTAFEEEFCGA